MTISDLVIQWLLASEIPSIRYLTYKDVLCYPAENPIVTAEYQNIQSVGPVPEILGRQIEGGQWPYAKHFYTPKYVSTHWTLMLLEELRIDPGEPRFLKAVEYMLDVTLVEVQNRIQTQNPNFICLWGNLLRYAVYAGLAGDTRVQSLITLVSNSLADTYCQCDINSNNPCSWGQRGQCGVWRPFPRLFAASG